jgi:hypothetical protein
MKELNLQKLIMLDASKQGWLVYHFNPGGALRPDGFYFNSGVPEGWPDLIVITSKNTYYLELKTPKGRLSKEQKKFQQLLPNSYVVRSLEQWREVADAIHSGDK